jgi:uncharacterized protein YceK
MKIFKYLLTLIIIAISISGCSSLIEADAKRFGFAFLLSLIAGVVGLLFLFFKDKSD